MWCCSELFLLITTAQINCFLRKESTCRVYKTWLNCQTAHSTTTPTVMKISNVLLALGLCSMAYSQGANQLEVHANPVDGSSVIISKTSGLLKVDVSTLNLKYVDEISVNNVYSSYMFDNYEEALKVKEAYDSAVRSGQTALAYALFNVLTTGGVITEAHLTINSNLMRESSYLFQAAFAPDTDTDEAPIVNGDSIEDQLVAALAYSDPLQPQMDGETFIVINQ